MTKNWKSARALTGLAAATLFAAPLAMAETVVVPGESQPVYQERVSFGDLDLRNGSGQRILRNRVTAASKKVCRQLEGPFPSYRAPGNRDMDKTCADLTYDTARPQISAAIDRAKSGQPHMAMALVLSAPRASR